MLHLQGHPGSVAEYILHCHPLGKLWRWHGKVLWQELMEWCRPLYFREVLIILD